MWLTLFLLFLYLFTLCCFIYLFYDTTLYTLKQNYVTLCKEAQKAYKGGDVDKGQKLAAEAYFVYKQIEEYKSRN